jgi:hypothetical protein
MSIDFSLDAFPNGPDVKDAAGLPWGAVVSPLSTENRPQKSGECVTRIARCRHCAAYINYLCSFGRHKWKCSLCRKFTHISGRYENAQQRQFLPELAKRFVEFEDTRRGDVGDDDDGDGDDDDDGDGYDDDNDVDGVDDGYRSSDIDDDDDGVGDHNNNDERRQEMRRRNSVVATANALSRVNNDVQYPAYIFLVDVAGTDEAVELLKSSVLAALEALHPSVYVGVAVFSHTLGVFDLTSTVPHLRYVRLPDNDDDGDDDDGGGGGGGGSFFGGGGGGGVSCVSLSQALPLRRFLSR